MQASSRRLLIRQSPRSLNRHRPIQHQIFRRPLSTSPQSSQATPDTGTIYTYVVAGAVGGVGLTLLGGYIWYQSSSLKKLVDRSKAHIQDARRAVTEHRNDVDDIARQGSDEIREIMRESGGKADLQTATKVMAILRKRGREMKELGRKDGPE